MLLTLYIAACLITVTISDIKYYRIPDISLVALAAAGAETGFRPAAAVLPLLIFALSAAVCAALKTDMPCGAGDAKLLAAFGLIGGLRALIISFAAGSVAAGAAAAVLLVLRRKKRRDRIAFGPFLCLGFLLYWVSTSAI